MLGEVLTRPVHTPGDNAFLLSLYAAVRRPELTMLGWDDAQVDAFIQMQLEAQTRHFGATFPEARHLVITVQGGAGGRLILDRTDREIRIVDLVLLPEFRRAGVGSAVVRRVCDEADADGLPVRCHVEQSNSAIRFWERLGLVACGLDGAHIAMERACATSPR
jgi:ribosomal protein S18 acetylase RimI-like enzyme